MNTEVSRVTALAHLTSEKISSLSSQDIVLDALHSCSGRVQLDLLSSIIKQRLGINMPQSIVDSIIENLVSEGKVFVDENYITMSGPLHAEITRKKSEDKKICKKAVEVWLSNKNLFESINKYQKDILTNTIDCFLDFIFIRHTDSCYRLIYRDQNEDFKEEIFDIDGILSEVTRTYKQEDKEFLISALPTIFKISNDIDILNYLNLKRIKAISYLSAVYPDEVTKSLLLQINNLLVYLDTNIIYRLLNLQGETRFNAVENVIKLCQRHGVIFKISNETYKELVSSIEHDAKVLAQFPIKTDLSAYGYRYRSSENYVSAYWKRVAETGVSVSDFIETYKNADIILNEQYGIEIENNSIRNEELDSEAHLIYSKLCLYDSEYERNQNAIWHDAYNISYVRKQQKSSAKNAVDSKCLFMSSDRMVLQLKEKDYELKKGVQFAISPSQLLQLVSFTTAEGDYVKTYAELFSSAAIGYNTKDYSNSEIQEILSRISHYNTYSDRVAVRVLENMLCDDRIKNSTSDEEKEEIVYKEISEELTNEIHNKQEENKELRSKETQLNVLNDSLKEALEKNALAFERSQEDNQNKDSIIKDYERKLLSKEDDTVDTKWRKWRNRHIIGFIFGLIIILAAISTLAYLITLISEANTEKLSVLAAILIGIIDIIIGACGIPLVKYGKKIFESGIKETIQEEYRTLYRKKENFSPLFFNR